MSVIQGLTKVTAGGSNGSGSTIRGQLVTGASLMFDQSRQTYLERSFPAAGNRRTWTYSVWTKYTLDTIDSMLFDCYNGADVNNRATLAFDNGVNLTFRDYSGGVRRGLTSTAVFRDPSAWYHIVVAFDSTQVSEKERTKIFVNNVRIRDFTDEGYVPLNHEGSMNRAEDHGIGWHQTTWYNGYMARSTFIDGQALDPSAFGEISNNMWVPKDYAGTYGNNGFYLEFGSSANIGVDSSGNGNDWTSVNHVATDLTKDFPTTNYCTLNPLDYWGDNEYTFADGSLQLNSTGNGGNQDYAGTFGVSSGAWYYEITVDDWGGGGDTKGFGITAISPSARSSPEDTGNNGALGKRLFHTRDVNEAGNIDQGSKNVAYKDDSNNRGDNGSFDGVYNDSTFFSNGATYGFAFDIDNNIIRVYKDGVLAITINGDPALAEVQDGSPYNGRGGGTADDARVHNLPTSDLGAYPVWMPLIKLEGGTANVKSPATGINVNFGQRDFAYTPPADHLALQSANLPAPAIVNSYEHFDVYTWVGNGAELQVGDLVKKPADTITINGSAIFNSVDTATLERTPAAAGNRQQFTLSIWVKRGNIGVESAIISGHTTQNSYINIASDGSVRLYASDGANVIRFTSDRQLNDSIYWHHIFMRVDTTQAAKADRCVVYIDGTLATDVSNDTGNAQNIITGFNDTTRQIIGVRLDNNNPQAGTYFDGYMSEIYWLDGNADNLSHTNFGAFDANGLWIPQTPTVNNYGTNGFYIGEIGGAGGGVAADFTPNNFGAEDQVTDTPTNNFATFNPSVSAATWAFSEGNRQVVKTGGAWQTAALSLHPTSGRYYFELTRIAGDLNADPNPRFGFGVSTAEAWGNEGSGVLGYIDGQVAYFDTGRLISNNEATHNAAPDFYDYANGETLGAVVDFDANTITFYADTDGDGASEEITTGYVNGQIYYIAVCGYNAGGGGGASALINTGQSAFQFTQPADTLLLNENEIIVQEDNLESPNFVWIKNRSNGDSHQMYDTVRGIYKSLSSDSIAVESNIPTGLLSFNSNGFTLGNDTTVNAYNQNYVAWCWKGAPQTVVNTDGNTNSNVSANTTAGFSIVEWLDDNGTSGTADYRVGHGLNQAPEFVIKRGVEDAAQWWVWVTGLPDPDTDALQLNNTNSEAGVNGNANVWGGAAPDATTIGNREGYMATAGNRMIAYCFHSVEGFSKIGSYTGNGSTDGPFIYTGFTPAYVLTKRTDGLSGWALHDLERSPYNVTEASLYPNMTNAETNPSTEDVDFLSNGFKIRSTTIARNSAGGAYIYLAFAEHPFKYSNAR